MRVCVNVMLCLNISKFSLTVQRNSCEECENVTKRLPNHQNLHRFEFTALIIRQFRTKYALHTLEAEARMKPIIEE